MTLKKLIREEQFSFVKILYKQEAFQMLGSQNKPFTFIDG